ncbi:neural cell adhesion molecule 2 isoform X2 [Teleopsis dalmanni]|uniref:neural cell adhesion molecule 2 isoform X2 n=1 Tax=Teleopsis dalmanni TaxID=139649 RepID=UPI0018CE13F9|nr:neural cell adhesion molecule 2 isoform X2 [Teleopsis dalmanni]
MVLVIVLLCLLINIKDIVLSNGSQKVQINEVLIGGTIYLPCNIGNLEEDAILLILWYREDIGTPIYSIDMRNEKAPKKWSDEYLLGKRAHLKLENGSSVLILYNADKSDSGLYRCRVDFMRAQTRNSKVQVVVIDPPKQIRIYGDDDLERSTVVGPYNEGDVVSLKCEVHGGVPKPMLIWYHEERDIWTNLTTSSDNDIVRSEVTIGPLTREDLNTRIACKAYFHLQSAPLEAVVQIDMNFAPVSIRLLGARQPLSAGRRYDLLCQSAGSRPPAVITWWKNGIRLEKTSETTSSDGNQTTSTLSIILNKSDAGKYLSCKAYNHAVPSELLEDGWKLDIQFVPEPHVRLGTSLESNSIKEGSDVYFDCMILSHPPVYKVEWRKNGQHLLHNITLGIIISNQSLVLQGVTRTTAGNYSCVGYNAEGEGISPPHTLNILYAPSCLPHQTKIYGAAKQESVKVTCMIDANPPDVEFSWTFNNSAESIDVATNHIVQFGTKSTVTYTPINELDYGTLLCTSANQIGKQQMPCVFHIIAAGRPDRVHNCSISNISLNSLTVVCNDGFNGGLPQLFILELEDVYFKEKKANITSTIPRFTISGLSPGGIYALFIYAINSKGRSDPITLTAAMLKPPEKQLTSESSGSLKNALIFSSITSLMLGFVMTILVAALAIILVLRIPYQRHKRHRKQVSINDALRNSSANDAGKCFIRKDVDDNEVEERNPDIVPDSSDSDNMT